MKPILRTGAIALAFCIFFTGSLVVQPALPRAKAAETKIDAEDLPPLPSEPDPKLEPKPLGGDFSDAPSTGANKGAGGAKTPPIDKSKSKVVGRNRTTTTYENPDGTNTLFTHAGPVNWKDRQGNWKEIETGVIAEGTSFKNKSGPMESRFPAKTGANNKVRITSAEDGSWAISFNLKGAADNRSARVASSTVTYPDVMPGVNLTYKVGAEELKETVVLKSPLPANVEPKFRFPLDLEGVTPVQEPDGGISFVDASGDKVLVVPPGEMRDSVKGAKGYAPAGSVTFTLIETNGQYEIEVAADEAWLRDPARVYPVHIDPTVQFGRSSDMDDAFAMTYDPNWNGNAGGQWDPNYGYVNKIGDDGGHEYATYMKFDTTGIAGHQVLSTYWYGHVARGAFGSRFMIYPVSQSWDPWTINWNTRAPHHTGDFTDITATAMGLGWISYDMTSWGVNWATGTWASHGLTFDRGPFGAEPSYYLDAEENGPSTSSYLQITYNGTPPTRPTLTSPGNSSVITTTTPTLVSGGSTDPDNDPLRYWYEVSTSAWIPGGSILNSGWVTGTSFTVPEGNLQDGSPYYWRVGVNDGSGTLWSNDVWNFKVDKRLGDQSVSPFDDYGPVRVNLFNGNLVLHEKTKGIAGVDGAFGLNFSYNSQTPSNAGLKATYSQDNQVKLVRTDPRIDFYWGEDSPAAGFIDGKDEFAAEWTGFITPATTGAYCFGARFDDRISIIVDGVTRFESWNPMGHGDTGIAEWGTNCPTLPAGVQTPFKVQYEEDFRVANASVWVRPQGSTGGAPIDASWFSTAPVNLPKGWSSSVDTSRELSYSHAIVGTQAVTLVHPGGSTEDYRWEDWAWKPSKVSDGALTQTLDGKFMLADEDGLTYVFNSAGKVESATTATDDRDPAGAKFEYGANSQLVKMIDPVSSREINLTYAGGGTCPTPPAGFAAAAAGMLCKVSYWDGTATNIHYNTFGQLARIVEPGDELTDYAYSGGKISWIRAPLAADMILAGQRLSDATANTVIGYSADKVSWVELPAPTAGADRPKHTYVYETGQTRVQAGGQSGDIRSVGYDAAGRATRDTDATGKSVTTTWSEGDLVYSTKDAAGMQTTTIYDHAKRPIETYGPAADALIDDSTRRATAGNENKVPRSTVAYQQGMPGLATRYFGNKNLQGAPLIHATTKDLDPNNPGALNKSWGSGAPSGLTPDLWSAQFTGEVLLDLAGTYTFRVDSDDGFRIYVDDKLIRDRWNDTAQSASGTFDNAAITDPNGNTLTTNIWRRIRVDYKDNTGPAEVHLSWTKPGGTNTILPGSHLRPGLGLVTSKTDADDKKTVTEYERPESGLPTASITDPDGLNLRSTTTYEAPGTNAFARRTSRALPKGAATASNYLYYARTEPRANPCPAGGSFMQAGLLKTSTTADPDGTGAKTGVTHETVYDNAGRPIATRVNTEANWACTEYDSRGRVSKSTDSSGKSTTFNYATPGKVIATYLDSSSLSRTTTSEVDLLGQATKYIDEHGAETRRVYNQLGRLTQVYRKFSGQIETLLSEYAYDAAGRMTSLTDVASGAPRVTTFGHDSAGRPTTTTRPNGVVTSNTFEADRGTLSNLSNKKGTTELSPWNYIRSLDGRVSSEETTGRTRTFTYDGAGRLFRTVEGPTTRNYSYDQNTNRCSTATSCDGSYVYDNADRLTESPHGSDYVYDSHGNMTSSRIDGQSSSTSSTFTGTSTSEHRSHQIPINSPGNFTASLDWAASTTTTSGSHQHVVVERDLEGTSYVDPSLPHGATREAWANASGTVRAYANWAEPANDLVLELLDGSGQVLATSDTSTVLTRLETISYETNATFSSPLHYFVRAKAKTLVAPGKYTIGLTVPHSPQLEMELYSPSGALVASTNGTNTKPESLAYVVPAGQLGAYTLRIPSPGSNYTITASVPTATYRTLIYDANDHTIVVNDEIERVEETLAPSGRVLRRVVKDSKTLSGKEDTTFGYDSHSDSPAYSYPTAGGEKTTFLQGASGLLVIYEGVTPTYPITNGHGDIVGNTDAIGAFTANPVTDEFGVGQMPANRLGYLGTHERFVTGSSGIIRMGVRLYDPAIGRFLSRDPVEGGCSNDYAYVYGDPMNQFDLDGRVTCPKWLHGGARLFGYGDFARWASFKITGQHAKARALWGLETTASLAVTGSSLLLERVGGKAGGKAAAKVVGIAFSQLGSLATIVDVYCSAFASNEKKRREWQLLRNEFNQPSSGSRRQG